MMNIDSMHVTSIITRARDYYGYGLSEERIGFTCRFCMPLGSLNIPEVGEEVEFGGCLYEVTYSNIVNMNYILNYTEGELKCVYIGEIEVVPEFIYDAEKLIDNIKEIFRKRKYE